MSFSPRLVALDIDGTLVDETNVVDAATVGAVRRVVDAGVPVVMATGRSWHSAVSVLEQLPQQARVEHVCSNGAVTVHHPPFEVGEVVTFDPRPVLARIVDAHPEALLAVEVLGRGYRVTEAFPVGELHGEIEQVDVDALGAEQVTRVIVRDPKASEADFVALAERLGLEGVSYSIGYTAWLDIAPEGIDKAHALARVAGRLGVDAADVLALGDGRNDLEMLQWAGRGVAMGQAPDVVLDAADAVTGTQAEGGLAAELGRWF